MVSALDVEYSEPSSDLSRTFTPPFFKSISKDLFGIVDLGESTRMWSHSVMVSTLDVEFIYWWYLDSIFLSISKVLFAIVDLTEKSLM